MRGFSFEQPATVEISAENGARLTASVLFKRDPAFLRWNRMQILGSRAEMTAAMRLHGDGPVTWKVHRQPDWPGNDVKLFGNESGSGWVSRTGMMSGASIAVDSIQPVAEITVFETVEQHPLGSVEHELAEYWFLQRPRSWFVSWRSRERSRLNGTWKGLGKSGLKFRFISVTWMRDDSRISREVEHLVIPGIEIRPANQTEFKQEFPARAAELWFCLRALLTFGLRQAVTPLFEHVLGDGQGTSKWHSVEIEPRQLADQVDLVRYPPVDTYVGKAASSLFKLRQHTELMHAAAYGYANRSTEIHWRAVLSAASKDSSG